MSSKIAVLGIEGGGTKTEWVALAGEERTIVHRGHLPPANLKLITDEALEKILRVLPREVVRVGVFLAGCATRQDRERLFELVTKVWPHAEVTVGSDRDSGFAAAFGDGDGIAVISGTGSAVTGRKDGRTEKGGGWGQLLGDKGGGYDLAMQGLRTALWHFDMEQRVTPLGAAILRALALNKLEDLVDWVRDADKMSVAKLAPVVFELAKKGDAGMTAVILDGARNLAEYSAAVARRLNLAAPEVKLLGGLFANHPEYLDLYRRHLRELMPEAKADLCTESGAFGAAWLADKWHRAEIKQTWLPKSEIEELAKATTELRNPRSTYLDQLKSAEMIELFVSEEKHVAEALAQCQEPLAAAVELVAGAFKNGGRLFYVGAGTSGRLGVLDASEIPPTFGAPPEMVQGIIAGGATALHRSVEGAEDDSGEGALAITGRGVRAADVVCGITASGRTPFVLGALKQAEKIGAHTILLTCNPARRRRGRRHGVEIDLPTGAELVTGSTRLKAGTATKVALNIISTCAMVRLGRVQGNLMVSLDATNAKLRDRATRLLSDARGLSYEKARASLEASGWDLRKCLSDSET
jgi:N-acetylmuramic acid 6-phosphate etherase